MIAFTVFEILHLETIQQLIQDFPYYRKELFEFHITKIELDTVEKIRVSLSGEERDVLNVLKAIEQKLG